MSPPPSSGYTKKMNLHSISLYFFWKTSIELYACSNNWNLSSNLILPSGFKFWFVQFPELHIKDPKNIHIDLKQDCSRQQPEEEGQWIQNPSHIEKATMKKVDPRRTPMQHLFFPTRTTDKSDAATIFLCDLYIPNFSTHITEIRLGC